MSEEQRIRCPQCGALAAPGAEWCGQCYAKLVRDVRPTSAVRSAAPAVEAPTAGHPSAAPPAGHPAVPPPPMPVPPAEPAAAAARNDRRAGEERREGEPRRAPVDRRVGEDRRSPEGRPTPASLLAALWEMPTVPEPEGLSQPMSEDDAAADAPAFLDAPARPVPTWPCAVCDTPNPLERDTCMSCGAPFSRLFQEPESRPEVKPSRAAKYSLLFPGLGHAVAGRKPEGAARAILFLWTAVTAILLLSAHPSGGLGILGPMAFVFVIGSLLWYAVTALDAYRLADGERQLVTSKIMLYSVAGLMTLTVGSVFLMVTKAGHLGH